MMICYTSHVTHTHTQPDGGKRKENEKEVGMGICMYVCMYVSFPHAIAGWVL